MPSPAHGRGEPDLAIGPVLVEQKLAARLEFDGQDAGDQLGIEIAGRRRLDCRLKPAQRRVG